MPAVMTMAVPEVSEEVRFKSGQGDFSTVNVSPQCAVHKDSALCKLSPAILSVSAAAPVSVRVSEMMRQ